jgi:CheY-like chemotaxis protein
VLDLNEVVERLAPMLRRLLGEDVAVATSHGPGNAHVLADAAQLEQVVLNLAVNARDAMPDGGTLSIGIVGGRDVRKEVENLGFEVAPGRYVQLVVRDTGIGIPRELQPRIFEPFFTTKEAGRGTGLGLATVYGTVKQSGGYILVESEAGQGATFTVALPEADPAAARDGDSRQPVAAQEATGAETVLVAEDEDPLRALTTRILEHGGYAVIAARDAEDAIQQAERHSGPIHLLLTDVVMPGASGRALIEEMRLRRPGIRVLYMSGHTDDEVVRRGVLDREVPFLAKPFSPWLLLQAVRKALDRP